MVILSVQEAAKFLGKTPAALRNGYKRWGIPHFRLGGQIKFTQEALQEWVEKNMKIESSSTETTPKNGRRTRRAVETKPTSRPGTHVA
ncbi:helix-turn-helix domain-containing protein [bacterium]|nr:helix-turn-helix domain-containing protein [bacterium]